MTTCAFDMGGGGGNKARKQDLKLLRYFNFMFVLLLVMEDGCNLGMPKWHKKHSDKKLLPFRDFLIFTFCYCKKQKPSGLIFFFFY